MQGSLSSLTVAPEPSGTREAVRKQLSAGPGGLWSTVTGKGFGQPWMMVVEFAIVAVELANKELVFVAPEQGMDTRTAELDKKICECPRFVKVTLNLRSLPTEVFSNLMDRTLSWLRSAASIELLERDVEVE